MKLASLREELDEEVSTILAPDFAITMTNTSLVPHSGGGGITFPLLDDRKQSCKLIDTCVLYIDIRRSTELNLQHRHTTMAKLYSAFVRAMSRCAIQHGGHVRGIIGDRVMVLFDSTNCFVSAVETAISMNSTATYVINKHFKANEVTCGIGIDAGPMLATKTGIQKQGHQQQSYRNLVWLGRPANIASKLTDIANKPIETMTYPALNVGRATPALKDWNWRREGWINFLKGFTRDYIKGGWKHADPQVSAYFVSNETMTLRPATPSILMTQAVFNGFKVAEPNHSTFTKKLWKEVEVSVPGYTGKVFGGDAVWTVFKKPAEARV